MIMFINNLLFNLAVIVRFCKVLFSGHFLLNKDVFDFERNVAQYFRLKYSVGVASGTDALMISLKATGVEVGDEIIVPALSFYSTAGAVAWIGAKPVFVDVSIDDLSLDFSLVEEKITAKTKAIIVAHLNGIVTDVRPLVEIAKKYNLFLIEDYAQSFGSFFVNEEKKVIYGDIVCLSLNAKKIFHGGGDGGAILTNNGDIFEKLKLIRMYGVTVDGLGSVHGILGIASRLGVWNAVILNQSFTRIGYQIEQSRKIFFLYLKFLEKLNNDAGLVLPKVAFKKGIIINGYRFVLLSKKRDELYLFLKKHNVDVKINYGCALHLMPAFSYLGNSLGNFPVAERVADESLTLPVDEMMSEKDVEKIVVLIDGFFKDFS